MNLNNFRVPQYFFLRVSFFLGYFLLLLQNAGYAQQDKHLDSLKSALNKASKTEQKLLTYSELTLYLLANNPAGARSYALEGIKLAKKHNDKRAEANLCTGLGNSYYYEGNYAPALDAYNRSLELNKSLKSPTEEARCYSNIGLVYMGTGNFIKAQDFFIRSLKLRSETDLAGKAYVLANLSTVQQRIGDQKEGLRYQLECVKIREKLGDKFNIAVSLNNLGNCYYNLNKKSEARKNYLKAAKLYESIDDKWGLADTYGNIALLEGDDGNYESSEKYHLKALELKKGLGDKIGEGSAWRNLGAFYGKIKKFDKALEALNTALKLFKETGALLEQEDTYKIIADVYHNSGNDKKAYEFQTLYDKLRDTLLSEAKTRAITEMATKYETEKKEKEIKIQQQNLELKNKKIELQNATIARDSYIKYSLFVVAIFVVIIAGILFYAYYNKKKSNKIISAQKKEVELQRDETEKQKIIVEEKNKEITDSITYARRIQNVLLSGEDYMKQAFDPAQPSGFFILYLPKDIVSGDFYWCYSRDKKTWLFTGDCTGHGVPGAFMSLLGISNLHELVVERRVESPNIILDELKKTITRQLNPDGRNITQDGMDASICCYDFEKRKLSFSAANHSVVIMNNGEMKVFKGDKQPIGRYAVETKDFRLFEYDLQKGDIVYTFSDGYADQFGGDKGQKMKIANFQKLLVNIHTFPMDTQKQMLHDAFIKWRGNYEQTDDVCVIGVKV